jgi:uncharacterized membrane protein
MRAALTCHMISLRGRVMSEKLTFDGFKDWAFISLMGALTVIAAFLATSVWDLNRNVAVVIERLAVHDRDIGDARGEIKDVRGEMRALHIEMTDMRARLKNAPDKDQGGLK